MRNGAQLVRVLVVEDNPSDAEILTEVLTYGAGESFAVEWVERACNGEERLAKLPRIDVALIDLKLPDADGLEALDRIHSSAPSLPIFVMTGFDDDALASESKRRGAYGYIVKGRYRATELRSLLLDAVAASELAATPSRAAEERAR